MAAGRRPAAFRAPWGTRKASRRCAARWRPAAISASRHLSVYAFSTENWNRPQPEIDALFDLLRLFVKRDLARLHKDGVRIRIVGSREGLERRTSSS